MEHTTIIELLLESIPKVDLRELVNLKNQTQKLKNNHLAIACLERLVEIAKTNLWGLGQHNNLVFLYNGAYWKEVSIWKAKELFGKAAEKMGVDKYTARYFVFRDLMYKQFQATALLSIDEQRKNININLQNGTFEINKQGGRLRKFKVEDFLTYQLPFQYDTNSKASLFQEYLDTVLPDIQLQKILAEYVGYIFAPQLKLEKTLILYGTGANGKSVFFEIINALLGQENVSHFTLQSLTSESGYYRAKLGNYLLNYASEINGKLETSIFKQLVSGEPIEARLPYGDPFSLKQYARMIFNCNQLPREVEHSDAYFRRFLIIPFRVTIPEEDQDKELAHKIIDSELSGVFNWVLDGLQRLLQNKRFSTSAISQQMVKQYRTETDSVQLFLEENNLAPSQSEWKSLQTVYQNYSIFCYTDHYRPLGKINFKKSLEALGFQFKRKKMGNVIFIQTVTNQDGKLEIA